MITVVDDPEYRTFCFELGRFTMAWTDAESALYDVLLHYAGVTNEVGRAIFSGARYTVMINFLRAIAENTKMSNARLRDLDRIFSQFNIIGAKRNFITHHTSGVARLWGRNEAQKKMVTDARRVTRIKNAEVHKIDSDVLNAMTSDLELISVSLHRHLTPLLAQDPDDFLHAEDDFSPWGSSAHEPTTWQYKSPSPKTQNQRIHEKTRKRERPPKPSQT